MSKKNQSTSQQRCMCIYTHMRSPVRSVSPPYWRPVSNSFSQPITIPFTKALARRPFFFLGGGGLFFLALTNRKKRAYHNPPLEFNLSGLKKSQYNFFFYSLNATVVLFVLCLHVMLIKKIFTTQFFFSQSWLNFVLWGTPLVNVYNNVTLSFH